MKGLRIHIYFFYLLGGLYSLCKIHYLVVPDIAFYLVQADWFRNNFVIIWIVLDNMKIKILKKSKLHVGCGTEGKQLVVFQLIMLSLEIGMCNGSAVE